MTERKARSPNRQARPLYSLRHPAPLRNTFVVEISPILRAEKRARPLKRKTQPDALQQMHHYLLLHGIPEEDIHYRPADYNNLMGAQAIWVKIYKPRYKCLRNQANRGVGLHVYPWPKSSTIPPTPQELGLDSGSSKGEGESEEEMR